MATTTQVTSPQPALAQNTVKESSAGMSVPVTKEWAALGAASGYAPLPPAQLRMFIIGPHGGGKTAFVASMPRTLLIDFEAGSWGIPRPQAVRLEVQTWEKLESALNLLHRQANSKERPFDRVVFDSVDQWVELMNPVLCARKSSDKVQYDDITNYGSKGAGYALLRNACWSQIKQLEQDGYSWAIIGHLTEKTITVNDRDRTVSRPVLFDTFARQISRNSDVVCSVRLSNIISTVEVAQKLPSGQVVKVPKQQSHVAAVIDMADTGSQFGNLETKKRGVPTLNDSITLPDILDKKQAWETFAEAYNQAAEEVKRRVST